MPKEHKNTQKTVGFHDFLMTIPNPVKFHSFSLFLFILTGTFLLPPFFADFVRCGFLFFEQVRSLQKRLIAKTEEVVVKAKGRICQWAKWDGTVQH